VSLDVVPVPEGYYSKKAPYSEHANTGDAGKYFTCSCGLGVWLSEREGRSYWVFVLVCHSEVMTTLSFLIEKAR